MPEEQQEQLLHRALPRSLRHWEEPDSEGEAAATLTRNAVLPMGWGRLIFAHTFDTPEAVAAVLCEEKAQERDIAFYLRDPHVVLSLAPHQLFMDPSHTFRLWLNELAELPRRPKGFSIRAVQAAEDEAEVNRVYAANGMVTVAPDFLLGCRDDDRVQHWVAVDDANGAVLGTVTGVDHVKVFGDPEEGSSLWCLAVSPDAPYPGIGRALVAHLAGVFRDSGRRFLDLSVMHDNGPAIGLYKAMGFQRAPVFTIKRKNPINEALYIAPEPQEELNPYAGIIVHEARRRGIQVRIDDPESGLFTLTFGGRVICCRESLSDLTSAVALSVCDDKRLTRQVLAQHELSVPRQQPAARPDPEAESGPEPLAAADEAFLAAVGSVVVKPARGEQGQGISVDVRTAAELQAAIAAARTHCPEVLLEEYVEGQDLRIVVIDYQVVAAALRLPPSVTGTGRHAIRELIAKQSRRREAATAGESSIPVDGETLRCVAAHGLAMEDVLPEGQTVAVRKTANLHTGGVLCDVTDRLHPALAAAAVKAAQALRIPVTGLDFLVPAPDQPDYVIIEANERPGLANHEPQPTAERFIDLLFPNTAAAETAVNRRS